MSDTGQRLARLRRERPRSRFLRASVAVLALAVVAAWSSGTIAVRDAFTARRWENLERFLTRDAVPYPLRAEAKPEASLTGWLGDVLVTRGLEPALTTVAISTVAIVLAALLAWLVIPFAAATLATARPFERPDEQTDARAGHAWTLVRALARIVLVLLRAVPEYLLAFLLLAILGPESAWPAVLALALHNAGILGRLGAETVENLEPSPLVSLRAIGAPRRALVLGGVVPQSLGRFLLYFFYRFETCVREATVLGMLGIVSLGYWIQDARSKQFYDEMLVLVGVGVLLVVLADLVSLCARRSLREEGNARAGRRKAGA